MASTHPQTTTAGRGGVISLMLRPARIPLSVPSCWHHPPRTYLRHVLSSQLTGIPSVQPCTLWRRCVNTRQESGNIQVAHARFLADATANTKWAESGTGIDGAVNGNKNGEAAESEKLVDGKGPSRFCSKWVPH